MSLQEHGGDAGMLILVEAVACKEKLPDDDVHILSLHVEPMDDGHRGTGNKDNNVTG